MLKSGSDLRTCSACIQDQKVKIWMGAIEDELDNVALRFENRRADFVLFDHAMERYIPDLRIME